VYEQVALRLERMILKKLRPGISCLRKRGLAQMLEVSRSSIRDVLSPGCWYARSGASPNFWIFARCWSLAWPPAWRNTLSTRRRMDYPQFAREPKRLRGEQYDESLGYPLNILNATRAAPGSEMPD
jgi:Bacterial regulatory proteins, gntR family